MSLLTPSLIDEFTDARKRYIGGSDIAAVLGKSRWKTPAMVYNEKVNGSQKTLNKHMQRGIHLEPLAASVFTDVIPCTTALSPVSGIVSHRYPHVGCHPDRILHFEDGRRGLLEIKCPDRFGFQIVRDNGIPDVEYELQTQYNMGIVDADVGYLMYFNADLWDWEIFVIAKDLDQQLQMFEAAETFWRKHVDPKVPPPAMELPEYGDRTKEIAPLEGDLLDLVRQYADFQAIIETAEADAKMVRTKILGMTTTQGTWQGHGYRMNFTMAAGKRTLSKSKLEADGIDPEKYMTEGKPYPILSVKPVKEEL